jgi:hypothetical protein
MFLKKVIPKTVPNTDPRVRDQNPERMMSPIEREAVAIRYYGWAPHPPFGARLVIADRDILKSVNNRDIPDEVPHHLMDLTPEQRAWVLALPYEIRVNYDLPLNEQLPP